MMDDKAPSQMPELKPCPFCGGHADLQYRRGNYAGTYVSCHTEDCFGNPSDDSFSFVKDEYAITAWNTRAASVPSDKERALMWLDKIQASYILALSTIQKKALCDTENCDELFDHVRQALTAPDQSETIKALASQFTPQQLVDSFVEDNDGDGYPFNGEQYDVDLIKFAFEWLLSGSSHRLEALAMAEKGGV